MARYFTDDHEWLQVEGDVATIGITTYASEQLGDVVFVELQDAGTKIDKEDEIGVVESVKAASEIYAPISGEIIEANQNVVDTPATVNESPEDKAWFYKIRISDASQLDALLDQDAYKALTS